MIALYPLRCAAELGTHRNSGFTNEGQKNSLFKCSPRHIAGREHRLMRFKYSDCKALHVTVVGQPMGKQHLPQHCASLLSPGPQPAGSIRRGGGQPDSAAPDVLCLFFATVHQKNKKPTSPWRPYLQLRWAQRAAAASGRRHAEAWACAGSSLPHGC